MVDPIPARLSSSTIDQQLQDQIESLFVAWSVSYKRSYLIDTSFHTYFTLDFSFPANGRRPSVVIEAKNFGVAATRVSDSRRRKAQETLYLLVHVRRYCVQTTGSRILRFQVMRKFLLNRSISFQWSLAPSFTSISDIELLRSLVITSKPVPHIER